MSKLDEVRLRKLQEMQQSQAMEELEMQQKVLQLEMLAKQLFTKDALARYGNIKAAYPEKAIRLLAIIGQAMQEGQISRIDDEQLKGILRQLNEKKEFHIKIR